MDNNGEKILKGIFVEKLDFKYHKNIILLYTKLIINKCNIKLKTK